MAVTRECPFPGLLVEIIHLIAKEMHMKIEPIIFNDNDNNTTLDTDDMHDALEYIKNGSADTLAMGTQWTPERLNHFSFSASLYKIQSRFIMKQHQNTYTSMWSFFFIFDSRTWLVSFNFKIYNAFQTIFSALVMQICLCVIIRQVEVHMKNAKPIGVVESTWQMIRLQLLQPEKIYFRSKAGKLSIIFFSLVQCAVLLGVFSSWILSNILRAGHLAPADSVERLIERIAKHDFHMVTTNTASWFYEELNHSRVFPFAELRAATHYNRIRETKSPDDTLGKFLLEISIS